nr:hypothetical protein OH820_30810 [Streptomyces sp. NBC_00857]
MAEVLPAGRRRRQRRSATGAHVLPEEEEVHIPGTEKWIALFPDDVISVTEAACGFEARTLNRRLRALGAPVTTHIFPGTHTGTYGYRELRHSLPMLLTALRP